MESEAEFTDACSGISFSVCSYERTFVIWLQIVNLLSTLQGYVFPTAVTGTALVY